MSLKLLLFIGLVALAATEAHHLLKKLHDKDLTSPFFTKTPDRAVNHLRKRRDAEATADESEEITDEEAAQIVRFFVGAAWAEDKVEILGGFLEEMSDSSTNLTIVGWQRVLDESGKVQELRTIQLVIPPKPEDEDAPTNIVEDDDDDDEEDDDRLLPHKQLKEIKEIFEPMSLIGIPLSITMEEFDDEGNEKLLIYLDKDELYGRAENFALYNKTTVASAQEVSDFITSLKPANLGKPSVLKYDVDGNFIADQSHIRPHILGMVMDHYEAPDKILNEGPEIIAQISQQYHQSEIPKQLSIHYNKAYPEYKWRVLVDPENYYVTRDVEITLTYDNFDLDESSDISYLVYGVKK